MVRTGKVMNRVQSSDWPCYKSGGGRNACMLDVGKTLSDELFSMEITRSMGYQPFIRSKLGWHGLS